MCYIGNNYICRSKTARLIGKIAIFADKIWKIMKYLCCLLFASCLLLPACKPDGEISGTVSYTDYYDGCSYPAGSTKIVKVQLLGGDREKAVSTVVSNNNGKFSFENVEDGTWLLRATLKKEDVIYEGVSETLYVDKGKLVTSNIILNKTGFSY